MSYSTSPLNTLPTPDSTSVEHLDEIRAYHEATWTYGDYTLTRRQLNGKSGWTLPRWTVRTDDRDLPSVDDNSAYNSDEVKFGVNWSAMGTRSIEETERYGYCLLNAAEAASYFNEIVRLANALPDLPR